MVRTRVQESRSPYQPILLSALKWYLLHCPIRKGQYRLVRAMCRIAPSPWLIETDRGQKMFIDFEDGVEQSIFLGKFEDLVSDAFMKLVSKGAVVLDIGAHSGYYTLLSASSVGSSGSVHAFEPVLYEYEKLKANIAVNGFDNVLPNNIAIWASVGQLPLYLASGKYSGRTSIISRLDAKEEVFLAKTTTIDTYVSENRLKSVDLIKLDIEGAEPYALRGGTETLSNYKPDIICEIVPSLLRASGSSAEELMRFMRSLSYKAFMIEAKPHMAYVYFSCCPRLSLPAVDKL